MSDLGFYLEKRGEVWCIWYQNEKGHPATNAEIVLWQRISEMDDALSEAQRRAEVLQARVKELEDQGIEY